VFSFSVAARKSFSAVVADGGRDRRRVPRRRRGICWALTLTDRLPDGATVARGLPLSFSLGEPRPNGSTCETTCDLISSERRRLKKVPRATVYRGISLRARPLAEVSSLDSKKNLRYRK